MIGFLSFTPHLLLHAAAYRSGLAAAGDPLAVVQLRLLIAPLRPATVQRTPKTVTLKNNDSGKGAKPQGFEAPKHLYHIAPAGRCHG